MHEINKLLTIMARLRNPNGGCPWDLEQNFASIAPYTLEEAHEVTDAIARGDMKNLEEELGDLLLQVVFHAQMAQEENLFNFDDVARGINQKMIRRHPHVFPHGQLDASENSQNPPRETAEPVVNSTQVLVNWERIKADEKTERGEKAESILGGIASGLPALMRAEKLQKKASKVGFDWNDPRMVIAKIREELTEVEAELEKGSAAAKEEELGDVLFAVVNLARHLRVDSEMALKKTNAKFERRFAFIEDALHAQEKKFSDVTLASMDALWNEAKRGEKNQPLKNPEQKNTSNT